MSQRDWLFYLTAGVISAILFVSVGGAIYLAKYQKYHTDEQNTASKDKNEDGRTQREDTCIDIVKNRTFSCVVYGPKPGDSEKYTEYDLRAQQLTPPSEGRRQASCICYAMPKHCQCAL